ncbi:hypothetical protein Cs7R123_76770 [Catellatospora sp. TT07R-123]|uniref:DUF4272 domain-containing protein n=1 Tax=Catellatospora sp. TT07R-123 TaxID=2733863 RepID=UPI001B1244DD|nr:DUF4272 domain-containing protein [Catellatospora sp. TT07R-123]GHJ50335.1 hypothetical protein Cs7R123_76770 [Catellatospora sp. TT07R-123]
MAVPAPDPLAVRAASFEELHRLGVPCPPDTFPLVWEPEDQVGLRPTGELEARAAILHVVLERCFDMPAEAAVGWLDANKLLPDVTQPEWEWITEEVGDRQSFALHLDALAGLAWTLGVIKVLDPLHPPIRLMELFPDLLGGEDFEQWRARTLAAPRDPTVVAAALDLHYCLDWSFQQLEAAGQPVPGELNANAIGQRRWALEWAVVFTGDYHDPPGGWEEVDLST